MNKEAAFIRTLLYIQGVYFFLTGLWPVIDINSFMLITCPKTDTWLVKAMGGILMCEGICFLLSGITNDKSIAIKTLAIMNAAVLAFIDCYYVTVETICKIYLGDAVIEIVLLLCWSYVIFRQRKNPIQYQDSFRTW